jgi:hypothetical protein
MTAILRNALLAAVAVSAMAGSALAGSQAAKTECDKSVTNDFWNGRCCGVDDADCLGRESHGHDRGDHGRQRG